MVLRMKNIIKVLIVILIIGFVDGPSTYVVHDNLSSTPIETADYVIFCKISKKANPPNVTAYEWYHNGTQIPGESSRLTLTDLHRYDSSGNYQCAAINTAGLGQPGGELDMKVYCKYCTFSCTLLILSQ